MTEIAPDPGSVCQSQVLWPWASFQICLCLFPPLHNGDIVSGLLYWMSEHTETYQRGKATDGPSWSWCFTTAYDGAWRIVTSTIQDPTGSGNSFPSRWKSIRVHVYIHSNPSASYNSRITFRKPNFDLVISFKTQSIQKPILRAHLSMQHTYLYLQIQDYICK
jgi:hypothetical protein